MQVNTCHKKKVITIYLCHLFGFAKALFIICKLWFWPKSAWRSCQEKFLPGNSWSQRICHFEDLKPLVHSVKSSQFDTYPTCWLFCPNMPFGKPRFWLHPVPNGSFDWEIADHAPVLVAKMLTHVIELLNKLTKYSILNGVYNHCPFFTQTQCINHIRLVMVLLFTWLCQDCISMTI